MMEVNFDVNENLVYEIKVEEGLVVVGEGFLHEVQAVIVFVKDEKIVLVNLVEIGKVFNDD